MQLQHEKTNTPQYSTTIMQTPIVEAMTIMRSQQVNFLTARHLLFVTALREDASFSEEDVNGSYFLNAVFNNSNQAWLTSEDDPR